MIQILLVTMALSTGEISVLPVPTKKDCFEQAIAVKELENYRVACVEVELK